jgi:hypothetical protein
LINVTEDESVPPAFVAFNKTDQLPTPKVYVTLFAVENWTLVLFPVTFWNDHAHDVGVFVVVSLNLTATGAVPVVTLVVKLATGADLLILMNVIVDESVPPEFVAFSMIDQLPIPKYEVTFCAVLN